jgi:prepilin-type N-terminal cleavage/methylation domain-containing protein
MKSHRRIELPVFINKNRAMTRRAFTLVELLVVIAIIGLLSTVAVVATNSARIKSRDTKRIADLKQIQLALSLYYDDKGYYPPSPAGYDLNGYYNSYDADWNTSSFAVALSPYLHPLPVDPINSACPPWNNTCYSYSYGNVGRYAFPVTYDLATRLEGTDNPQRCGVRDWKWGLGIYGVQQHWCVNFGGAYSNQMYEITESD